MTSLGSYSTQAANLAAWASACTRPRWSEFVDAAQAAGSTPPASAETRGAPQLASSGADLQGAIKALVRVRLRANVHRRECTFTVTTFDAAANYTITISGTGETVTTPSDVDDLLTTMRDDLNANGTIAGIVTATALDANGEDVVSSGQPATSLKLVGVLETDYSIDFSETGTGELACTADAVSATAKVFATEGGLNADGTSPDTDWTAIKDGTSISVANTGYFARIDTGGLARLYVGLYSIAGHASDNAAVTYAPVVRVAPSSLN